MRRIVLFVAAIFLFVLFPQIVIADSWDYTIRVHYEGPEGFLTLHDSDGQQVARYPVALPYYMPSYLPAVGRVVRTLYRPTWVPTANICRRTGHCRAVPPGPANPLGVGFFVLRFSGRGDNMVGIHGTNQPSKIGKRVSSGCIRMHNADWKKLEARIRGSRIRVILGKFPRSDTVANNS